MGSVPRSSGPGPATALPLGSVLARQWARDYEYPLEGADDLIKVSQIDRAALRPGIPEGGDRAAVPQAPRHAAPPAQDVPEVFRGLKPPDFRELDEPHGVLARLPLPVYMTTNYDDFMSSA